MYDLMLWHQNKFGGIAWRNGEDEQFSDAARLSSSDLILVDPQMERDMRNDNHFRSTAPLNEPLAAQLEGNKSKCVQWLHLAWIKSPFLRGEMCRQFVFFSFLEPANCVSRIERFQPVTKSSRNRLLMIRPEWCLPPCRIWWSSGVHLLP